MKKTIFSLSFLFVYCFSGFGQVDSVGVVREVDSLIQVSRTLTGQRDFDQAIEVNAAAEKLAFEKIGRETAAYGDCCFNHGRVLYIKGTYPEAEKWYLDALSIRRKVLDMEHPDYARSLNNLAILYFSMGSYEKAEPLYLESKAIREKTLGKEHPEYAKSLINLAILYSDMGNYEKAEPLLIEAKAIRGKIGGEQHPDFAQSLNSLASLYSDMGNYEKAEPFFLKAKAIREIAFGKEHTEYANSLNNLAILYWEMGNYEKVEPLYLEAIVIWEKTLGKEHIHYAASLNNLANLYIDMGNYEKAEPLLIESIAIREKTLGKEHPDYAKSLNSLAALFKKMGNYEKAEPLLIESITIREKALGKEHLEYANSLNSLAALYGDMGKYEKAELLYLEAKAVLEKTLGKEHRDYATILRNLASLYQNRGNYGKAEPLYLEAKAIREKALGKEHPHYTESLNNLANLHWAAGDFNAADPFLLEAGAIEKSLLVKATRHLSERELSSYAIKFADGLNRNFSFAHSQKKNSVICYDNTLFYKGFLIVTASQVNKLALTDSLSTEKINLLKSYHRRLAKQYTLPIPDRDSTLVADLETKANDTEKDLARTVAGFGEALRQVTWQEVQAALKPNEAAIEFIRFNYYDPDPTDSIIYAALLLKPGMESPVFISLFEEKQLEALLAPLAGLGSDGWNDLYSGQAGTSLYNLLWSPMEAHLEGVKTIYFSPAGLLHRLNVGAIPSSNNLALSDHFDLVAMGSTRQLVTGNPAMTSNDSRAAIFGGIQYEMDSTAIAPTESDDLSSRRGLSFNQTDPTLRGGDWKYLKNSGKEADNIQALLQNAGFQAEIHKGYAATEEAFKQLGKDKPSPRILHVSTHGFFFPDPVSAKSSQSTVGSQVEPVFKISDHPMIRSGLVFAGANYAWQTGKPLGHREDGILTAYEISQMDLRNTELVVLSACETGLGDIKGNEGVYGLQRAFKIAGAKNLIMSLWQVPDYQTQELMTVFYQKWLEDKMTVRQALKAAQEEMKKKRYEPFYWAGFVLVE